MNKLKEKLKTNSITKGIYSLSSKIYNYKYKLMSNEEFAKKRYKIKVGKDLNLDNPKTYDEKIWWLKFNYHNPLITMCCDKYWVREYVRMLGYEKILNKIYGVYDSVEEIDFDSFPDDRVFLKTNHGSGTNIIYDKNKPFNMKTFKKKFGAALKRNYYDVHREWGYKNIEPKIICEKLLPGEPQDQVDFRFFCFNGKTDFIAVNLHSCRADGTHDPDAIQNIYTPDFKLRKGVTIMETPFDEKLVPKPHNFDEMRKIAEDLAKPFPHVRVDLYNIKGKIYFGEMTFYKGGGFNFTEPEDFIIEMGKSIDIEKIKSGKYGE